MRMDETDMNRRFQSVINEKRVMAEDLNRLLSEFSSEKTETSISFCKKFWIGSLYVIGTL